MGVFKKINFGLRKTRNNMSGAIDNVLDSYTSIDEELFDELEEALVMGDVGVTTASEITKRLNERVRKKGLKKPAEVKTEIKEIVAEMLEGGEDMGLITIPSVILVIGVNGVGKTTTIGKMASMYKAEGKSVILAAADTFRAAAIDQLTVWAERAGVDIISHKEGADPAAVIFDTISAAKARGNDIIICDTAGRLHNKKNLMEELAKIYRVIDRELPYSDREVLLVLDATTGQNAVNQAREFAKIAEITGIILTKLDGTARGGVVLSIKNDLKVPVKFVGVGEGIDDLQPFNPHAFAEGLFEALPEDFKEDDIDLSQIKEEITESEDNNELKEMFEEVIEAFNEIKEDVEEEIEEFKEDVKEAVEDIKEEITSEIDEVVEEMQETVDEIDEVTENTEVDNKPEKKKGFFGRLFK
ncbi:MAG: signal recognition particle-docking protein FtsY [Clostridia bacterium]|nr:signal recognition particle-docking protein FtsY [Clostridia bacterium]MBR3809980.1 signal recognition particle-docking protein FtsY [Clostridia bacterium]